MERVDNFVLFLVSMAFSFFLFSFTVNFIRRFFAQVCLLETRVSQGEESPENNDLIQMSIEV